MNTSTARIGCARVSKPDQNPKAQVAVLQATGCAMIRTETGSGSNLEIRPELGVILDFIHQDKTPMVGYAYRPPGTFHEGSSAHCRKAQVERRQHCRNRAARGYLDRSRQGFFRHGWRLCRVRDQPAARAAGRGNCRGQRERHLSRVPAEGRYGRNLGSHFRRAVNNQDRSRDGDLTRNCLQRQRQGCWRTWQNPSRPVSNPGRPAPQTSQNLQFVHRVFVKMSIYATLRSV